MVAISVDKIDEGVKTQKKNDLSMVIISDPSAEILKEYHLINQVPDDLFKKYKDKYDIDLEIYSGEKHHKIAVPGVFVVNSKGIITYSFVEEDYKKRAPEKDIIKAIQKISSQK